MSRPSSSPSGLCIRGLVSAVGSGRCRRYRRRDRQNTAAGIKTERLHSRSRRKSHLFPLSYRARNRASKPVCFLSRFWGLSLTGNGRAEGGICPVLASPSCRYRWAVPGAGPRCQARAATPRSDGFTPCARCSGHGRRARTRPISGTALSRGIGIRPLPDGRRATVGFPWLRFGAADSASPPDDGRSTGKSRPRCRSQWR